MIALREIAIQLHHGGRLCCASAAHPGARLSAVALYPAGSTDERTTGLLASLPAQPAQRSPGMEAWLVERLAEVAPLVCFVGGERVNVGAVVNRMLEGSVWQ